MCRCTNTCHQNAIKSSFSSALIGTTRHQILANFGTNQGHETDKFSPALRAGGRGREASWWRVCRCTNTCHPTRHQNAIKSSFRIALICTTSCHNPVNSSEFQYESRTWKRRISSRSEGWWNGGGGRVRAGGACAAARTPATPRGINSSFPIALFCTISIRISEKSSPN